MQKSLRIDPLHRVKKDSGFYKTAMGLKSKQLKLTKL
jgi:hypothetical protein